MSLSISLILLSPHAWGTLLALEEQGTDLNGALTEGKQIQNKLEIVFLPNWNIFELPKEGTLFSYKNIFNVEIHKISRLTIQQIEK